MNFSIKSIYNWYRDTIRNPKYRWWIILGTILYLVSPIDIAPDLFPIVGQIDDLAVLTILVSEMSQLIIDSAKARHSNIPNSQQETKTETVEVNAVSVE
jgi:uncharacterized membrane protein YkvA (DUF1232 family)